MIKTSRTEVIHLSIAIFIFFVIKALSYYPVRFTTTFLVTLALSTLFAYIIHEMAHKITALYYDMWAEFRLDPKGMVISLFTAVPWIPLKIIAPGSVMIVGHPNTSEEVGKTALSGPLSNIATTLLFFSLTRFHPILAFIASLNADLAFFNLLPYSTLDGNKVFNWSKTAWMLAYAASIILYVLI